MPLFPHTTLLCCCPQVFSLNPMPTHSPTLTMAANGLHSLPHFIPSLQSCLHKKGGLEQKGEAGSEGLSQREGLGQGGRA